VVAFERVSLYGLTLADKRVVHYGPLAREESRELMIREGLVPGNVRPMPAFLKHNRRLVQELEELETRTRRRDILVDEQLLFDFYAERLPEGMYTAAALQSWLKRNPDGERGLYMTREILVARDPGEAAFEQFPDHLVWEDMRFKLSYQFEPGQAADGVSITVPVALLNRTPRYLFDWLVPGLLREKCIQLVKALPKEKRKRLVPAPDFVDRALQQLTPDNVDLLASLAHCLSRLGGVALERSDWLQLKLDDYYRMNVRVVDAQGQLLGQGRDLAELVQRFAADTRQSISAIPQKAITRAGITRWDFGDLPCEWRFRQAGIDIVAYPALVDKGESAAIELCDYPAAALIQHRLGVLRLLRLAGSQQVKYLRKQLLRGNEFNLVLAAARLERDALVEDLIDAAYLQGVGDAQALPRSEAQFHSVELAARAGVIARANDLEALLLNALRPLADVRRRMAALPAGKWGDTLADMQSQLSRLWAESFQRDTPADWLAQYPRYMKALLQRLERLAGQYPKDQKYTASLAALTQPLQDVLATRASLLLQCSEACSYRWLLEEFRVSLFAQNLGTRQAVSQKRLQEQWQNVSRWLRENPH
jgi:ATP-dependent helicase HrpA